MDISCLLLSENGLDVQFLWIVSDIGFSRHDHVDKIAKQICVRPEIDLNLSITSNAVKAIPINDAFKDLAEWRGADRPGSINIKCYDRHYTSEHSYGKHRTRTRH